MVKSTMTGGSGSKTAVPLSRDPVIVEVVLLPEKIVLLLEKALDGLLLSSLPSLDCGLVIDGLLGLASSSLTPTMGGRCCTCHICNLPCPDFVGLEEPLKDQETFVL